MTYFSMLYSTGEVGVYFDVDEVVLRDTHAFGSAQFQLVELNNKLFEGLLSVDLIRVKGELEKQGLFRGVVLEEFRTGL